MPTTAPDWSVVLMQWDRFLAQDIDRLQWRETLLPWASLTLADLVLLAMGCCEHHDGLRPLPSDGQARVPECLNQKTKGQVVRPGLCCPLHEPYFRAPSTLDGACDDFNDVAFKGTAERS
jgi:hypothetical protein